MTNAQNNARCRFCGEPLRDTFCDLGVSPISNTYLSSEQLNEKEPGYPLHAWVCSCCLLVQLQEFQSPKEIFSDYAYFSSYSSSWLRHCQGYVDKMIERFHFNSGHQVIEIASNDGYLLQFFMQEKIPVLGIEPAENVAKTAKEKGIPTIVDFFGTRCSKNLKKNGIGADLLIGNNVLAHVPNLNDFVEGMRVLLKPEGIITMEFPHLHSLMQFNQFDTIYHEHFSYFSFLTVEKVFAKRGLKIFDVDLIDTHGGSLRIYATSNNHSQYRESAAVNDLRTFEISSGYDNLKTYLAFDQRVKNVKNCIREFLEKAHKEGKKVAGYGAPAKGNTLLNSCTISREWIDYTVDLNPHKQGKFLPGTKIPIFSPEKIFETKPDFLFILPWNLKDEIKEQMKEIRQWGGQFVVPIPNIEVF